MKLRYSYTRQSSYVLYHARQEALHRRNPCVEPEHLLLGLLRQAPELMTHCSHSGRPAQDLFRLVAHRIPPGHAYADEVPWGATCKSIMEHAKKQARGYRGRLLGADHILLALVTEPSGALPALLAEAGLSLEGVRHALADDTPQAAEIRRMLRAENHRAWARNLLSMLKTASALAFACQTWLVLGLALGDPPTPSLLRILFALDLVALAWPLAVSLPKLLRRKPQQR